jgi:hypothetical protein
MKVKSFLKLLKRAACRHPVISDPLEIRLDYRHRVWGVRAYTVRESQICHCVRCGQMFGQYMETTRYDKGIDQ